MAYYYRQFGDIEIPTLDQKTIFNQAIQDGSIVSLPGGGYYSFYNQTPLALCEVSVSFMLKKGSPRDLFYAYAAWEAALLKNQEQNLWRVPNSGDEWQFCLAKLKSISASQTPHISSPFMRMTVNFTLLHDRWRGSNILTLEKTFTLAPLGATITFLTDGNGNVDVKNSQMFIRVDSGELDQIMIEPENNSRTISYTAPLIAGENLRIDDEKKEIIKNDTQPAYKDTQTASNAWMPIKNGGLKLRLFGSEGTTGLARLSYHRAYA
jgi:hypothetical protein